jgi:hypothetical protein
MHHPFAHRTKRIFFLFVLLPTVTLAYITLPRGDVRLPAENVRARTQDITIAANTPSIERGRFLNPLPTTLSRSAGVRTPADEAAIEELALTAAATPLDLTARLAAENSPRASSPSGFVETSSPGSDRSRRSSAGGRPYPLMLARGIEAAASGVSGTAQSGTTSAAGTTQATTTTDAPAATATTAAATTLALTAATSSSSATSAPTTTSSSSSRSNDSAPGQAAPPAVAAGGQNAIANTENTSAGPTVAEVFSGSVAGGVSGNAGQGNPPVTSQGTGQGGSPASQAPSPTPEPLTLLLTASGLACVYGARRYIL